MSFHRHGKVKPFSGLWTQAVNGRQLPHTYTSLPQPLGVDNDGYLKPLPWATHRAYVSNAPCGCGPHKYDRWVREFIFHDACCVHDVMFSNAFKNRYAVTEQQTWWVFQYNLKVAFNKWTETINRRSWRNRIKAWFYLRALAAYARAVKP